MSTINERIKQIRKDAGLSQSGFGEQIGISLRGVQMMEANDAPPRESTIRSICATFNISRGWLLEGFGDMHLAETDDTAELLDEKLATGSDFSKALLRTIAHMPDDQLAAVENFFVALQQEVQKGK